jgi:hypothetical protein
VGRRGEPADEVARSRGRRTVRQRDRRTGRTRKSTSLRRGRWTGEAGTSPRGAAARNHPSGGLRPERRMGSGRGDREAGRRAGPGCADALRRGRVPGRGAQVAGRSACPRAFRRTCFGTGGGAPGGSAGSRDRRAGRTRRSGRTSVRPGTGDGQLVTGWSGRKRTSPERRLRPAGRRGEQANLPGMSASAGRKERRASGRGGWTGLLGTNVQQKACFGTPERRGRAGRSPGRSAATRTAAHGLRPGRPRGEEQPMSRDRRNGETGGEVLLRQGSVKGATGSTAGRSGRRRTSPESGLRPTGRGGEQAVEVAAPAHRHERVRKPRFGVVERHGKAGASPEGTAGRGLAAHGLRPGRGGARAGRGRRTGESTRAHEPAVLRHGRGRGASRSVARGIEPRGDRRTEGFGPTGAGSRVVEVLGLAGSRVSRSGCFGIQGEG